MRLSGILFNKGQAFCMLMLVQYLEGHHNIPKSGAKCFTVRVSFQPHDHLMPLSQVDPVFRLKYLLRDVYPRILLRIHETTD